MGNCINPSTRPPESCPPPREKPAPSGSSHSWAVKKAEQFSRASAIRLRDLSPNPRRERRMRFRSPIVQPLDEDLGHRLQILEAGRILVRLADLRDQLANPLPHEQHFHSTL